MINLYMHRYNFLFQISGGTFHLVLDFPCALFIAKHCYFAVTVSKEIQNYDQRKFYFFSEKKHFQIWYSRSSLKRKWQKYNFFSIHENCKKKKFAISRISNKKFLKIHYFANIKYKRNSPKYCEKNLCRNIFVKRKIFAKRNTIKKIFSKKKIVEKNFRKKMFEKTNSNKNF